MAHIPTKSFCRTCDNEGEVRCQQGYLLVVRVCPTCAGKSAPPSARQIAPRALSQYNIGGPHWRDTYRPARLFWFEATAPRVATLVVGSLLLAADPWIALPILGIAAYAAGAAWLNWRHEIFGSRDVRAD